MKKNLASSSLGKHQMADDAGAAGGPGGPGGPRIRRPRLLPATAEDSAAVLGAVVVAEAVAVVEAAGLVEVKLKTRSGSPSPSWAAWLRT